MEQFCHTEGKQWLTHFSERVYRSNIQLFTIKCSLLVVIFAVPTARSTSMAFVIDHIATFATRSQVIILRFNTTKPIRLKTAILKSKIFLDQYFAVYILAGYTWCRFCINVTFYNLPLIRCENNKWLTSYRFFKLMMDNVGAILVVSKKNLINCY